jgi:hypothetical protein
MVAGVTPVTIPGRRRHYSNRHHLLVPVQPTNRPRELSNATAVDDHITSGELHDPVNCVDSVNATGAANVALALLPVAVARLGRSIKSIPVTF